MNVSGYYAKPDDNTFGDGYRLDKTEVVQKGRRRELAKTVSVMLTLYAIQALLFLTATGVLDSKADLAPVISARLSLLVDIGCILAQLFVAYRAWGLVRSRRPGPQLIKLSQWAVGLVLVGSLLDFIGNFRLWVLADADPVAADLTLSVSQSFWTEGAHGGTAWYTWAVAALTIGGLGILFVQVLLVDWTKNNKNNEKSEEEIRKSLPALSPVKQDDRPHTIICCSGGGIRATAFSLGGLQTLQGRSDWDKTTAIVGVSGGGYIAAAQHILRWNPSNEESADGEWPVREGEKHPFAVDSPETKWLRRHTQYVMDSFGAFTQGALSLALGIAVNILLAVVAIGGTAWLLAWLFLTSGRLRRWEPNNAQAGIGGDWAAPWAWIPEAIYAILLAAVVLFVLDKAVDRFYTAPSKIRDRVRSATQMLITVGVVLFVLILCVPWLVEKLSEFAADSDSAVAALLQQIGLVPHAICETSLKVDGGACGLTSEENPKSALTVSFASLVAVVSSILAVLASAKSAAHEGDSNFGVVRGPLVKLWNKVKHPLVPYLSAAVIITVGVCFFLREVTRLVIEPDMIIAWKKAFWVAGLLVLAKVFTDANRTSLHHFFRERISEAFFVRRTKNEVSRIAYSRPLRFSQAAPPQGKGPRLIACAVANVSDQSLVPSQRGCIPFVFSHSRMGLTDRLLPEGAARRRSAVYEFAADNFYRDATIPAAAAISAAAFAPLAGRENVRVGPYRLVLALANARLGVWLPNPLWIDEALLVKRMAKLNHLEEAREVWANLDPGERAKLPLPKKIKDRLEAGPAQDAVPLYSGAGLRWNQASAIIRGIFKKPGMFSLVREAVGKASVYDRFLYITDGGHYDNLGLIEALRRKPARIFVLDASNDPEDTFQALGRAIATARMDLNCDLVMDPRGMRRLAKTRSGAAWCVGKYSYPNGSKGDVYLAKAVLPEGLSWDIETYKLGNDDFPRTSTGKQLYSEFDFEAYRALGSSAVKSLLASPDYFIRAHSNGQGSLPSGEEAASVPA